MNMEEQTFCQLMNKSLISPTFLRSYPLSRLIVSSELWEPVLPSWTELVGAHTYYHCVRVFFLINNIWWEYSGYLFPPKASESAMSSTFKGQESDISPCLHHCLPMSSFAKGNGTDGKSTRDEACFHSLPFLLCPPPFPLRPGTASRQCKQSGAWISVSMWSTPSRHNERPAQQRYGKYFHSKYLDIL